MADLEKITKKRLGEILVAEGVITQEQVTEALKMQERTGEMVGEALVKAGYTTETEIAKTLCTQFAKPFLKASRYDIPRDVLVLFSPRMMIEHVFIPLDRFGNLLTIVIAGLLDAPTIADIQKQSACDVEVYIGTASDVKQTLRNYFPDYFDPITQQPRLDLTQMVDASVIPTKGEGAAALREKMGTTTRELVGIAEDESTWEALFEEAEREVMKELKDKKRGD